MGAAASRELEVAQSQAKRLSAELQRVSAALMTKETKLSAVEREAPSPSLWLPLRLLLVRLPPLPPMRVTSCGCDFPCGFTEGYPCVFPWLHVWPAVAQHFVYSLQFSHIFL